MCLSPPPEENSTSDTTGSSPEHQGESPADPGLPLTTLTEPARDSRSASPMPVPPPRRKRKTKGKSAAPKKSPTPIRAQPEAASVSDDGITLQENASVQSNDVKSGEVNGHNSSTSDNESTFEGLMSPLLEPILRGKSDATGFRSDSTSTSLLVGDSASARPHSVMSPSYFQSNADMMFLAEGRGGSTAFSTLPRNMGMAVTWSPKSDLLRKKSCNATPAMSE